MSEPSAILFLGPGEPQLGPMLAAGLRRVVIGVDSRLCLTGSLGESAARARESRQAMFYRLEEHVPFPAEDMWADFLATDSGALGICTLARNVQPVVAALADAGIAVAAICPTALLALQHALESGAVEPRRWDALLWQSGADIEVFFLNGKQLAAWHMVPADAADVGRVLFAGAAGLPSPPHVGAIAVEPGLLESLRDVEPAWEISHLASLHTEHELAILAAEAIIDGHTVSMVDLRSADAGAGRRHSRLRGPGRAAVVAFTILCAAAVFAIVLRGIRYHAGIAVAENQARSAYAAVFPHSAIPLGIESRLRSACQSLNVSASAPGSTGPAADPWLLPLLDRTLRQLPANIRFTVDSLRLEDHQFVMEGRVLSFADADALAMALRSESGLTVDEPQTQRADSAVAFTLSGRLAEQQANAGSARK